MAQRSNPLPPPPDDCPLERYLHVVSGTWVPRIVWYLRFGKLRRDLDPISSKVLTTKLCALEADGLVVRWVIEVWPLQVEYCLSTRGRAFDPVYEAMVAVAAKLEKLDAAELARRRKTRTVQRG